MPSWPSVSMMSTAMSRSLLSYSRAWGPQKTRSLPLARTTRTLANAPQRSQWKGTTRSSAGGVVVSVWVIWVITRSLPHGPAAADRPPAQRQDGPRDSRSVPPNPGLAGRSASRVPLGLVVERVAGTSLVRCRSVSVVLVVRSPAPLPAVGPCSDRSHATPLTRGDAAYTAALALPGDFVTDPQQSSSAAPACRGDRPRTGVVPGAVVTVLTSPEPRTAASPRPETGGGSLNGRLLVQVVAQDLGPAGVAQLRHRLGLDLPDPLAGDPVDLADLVEGPRLAVGEAEPQPDDAGLPLPQRLQDAGQLVLHPREAHRVDRDDRLGVLDEVAELAVALVADGLVEADRLPGVLLDLQHLVRGDVHLLGQLLRGGLAPEVLEQLALDAAELVDHLDHVHRDADGTGLVGHRAGDRLADPPGGVGGELVALGVVELLHRADQTEVALLDEVQEGHAAAGVALGEGHHEPEVGLDELALGDLPVALDQVELAADGLGELELAEVGLAQLLGGEQAGLDPLRELDLLLGVEQRDPADLLEVGADRVGRGGELGVLAGLPQRLGLLLVVPLEVGGGLFLLAGGRGDLAVSGAFDHAVGAGDDRLVEGEPLGRGARGGGRVGDGGEDSALGAGGGGDGGLAACARLGGCLLL